MVALQILVLTVGVRILLGELKRGCPEKLLLLTDYFGSYNLCGKPRFFWPLRITASTADSHSVNRSSILLGAINKIVGATLDWCCFFALKESPRIELRNERLQNCEQWRSSFAIHRQGWRRKREQTAQREKTGGFRPTRFDSPRGYK